jgi:hydrogenase small subunit
VDRRGDSVFVTALERTVSRRTFMKFCAAMTAALALPPAYLPRVAAAVAAAPRVPLIWIRAQACGADGEAFLRAANPTTAELLLQFLSIDYLEALMVPSGANAGAALAASMKANRGSYLAVVEGSVPTADGGAACTVGGRSIQDVIREVSAGAVGTIAVGSCAFDGGLSAASGGTSGASGVGGFVSGKLIQLPGCPVNATNLAATIVHYLTFKELPPTDAGGRPLFAYGALIHNECERRAHFEFGEFVQAWGDEGAQKGWCLYKMGCKGPETYANCASVGFDGGTSWPVKAGVGCIGCTMPAFWDAMSPFQRRLPSPLPFLPGVTADDIGQAAVAGIAGVAGLHAVGSYVRANRQGAAARRAVHAAVAVAEASPPTESIVAPEVVVAIAEPSSAAIAESAPVATEAAPAASEASAPAEAPSLPVADATPDAGEPD